MIHKSRLVFAGLMAAMSTGATAPATTPAPSSAAAPAVLAPSGSYRSESDHSSIVFRVRHLGMIWFTARFTAFTVDMTFDAARPEASALSVTIDPSSVQTGVAPKPSGNFDNELASSPKFFNTGAFPRMQFIARRIDRTGPATARMTGDMTILGVTRPLVLDVVYNGSLAAHPFSKKPVLGFSATGSLKRSDYGMTYLVGMVGDEVRIAVEAELVGK